MKRPLIKIIIPLSAVILLILGSWLLNGGSSYLENYAEVRSVTKQYYDTMQEDHCVDLSLTTEESSEKISAKHEFKSYKITRISFEFDGDNLQAIVDVKIFDVDHSGEDLEVFLILQETENGWKIIKNI